MNDKKNIDRFFQEKFKDFESEPDDVVWKNIEANLKDKNNKRRIIPFWIKLSGIAAALVLGMFFVNIFLSETSTEKTVVLEEKSSKIKVENANPDFKDSIELNNKNTFNNNENSNKVVLNKINDTKNEIGVKENNILNNKIYNFKKNSIRNNKAAFVQIKSKFKNSEKQKKIYALNKIKKIKNSVDSKNLNKNNKNSNESQFLNLETLTENKLSDNVGLNNNLIENKENVIEKITDVKPENKKSDAIAKVETIPNVLEELVKKNDVENKKSAKTKLDRWQITSNVAPIYFSSTSNGSPIDAEFVQNKKSYDNNLSLGLGVNYALSKKIKLRFGVNKLTLGYSTKDVVFQAGLSSKTINNIANSSNGAPIKIINKDNSAYNLMAFEQNINSYNEGQINQKMGYYEVPLEMSYAVVDRKFGINLIGGLSTLFLTENNVSVSSANMTADLGKATNLSNVHFSTNLGIGFKYKFFKAFEAKLEPTFKYQINTFSNDVGSFKPYFIGLYSGVSFGF